MQNFQNERLALAFYGPRPQSSRSPTRSPSQERTDLRRAADWLQVTRHKAPSGQPVHHLQELNYALTAASWPASTW